ncbi:MAG: hypothetical protein PHX77_07190 [Candidatus Bipolaricaulis sp.]|nr:hypothetical protein [Candidatus Bipolaricaulis sp.]
MVVSSHERSAFRRGFDAFVRTSVFVVVVSFVVMVSLIALLPVAGTVAARR